MAEQNSGVWKWLTDSRTYIAAVAVVVGGLVTNYVKPGILLTSRVEALEEWQADISSGFDEMRWGQRWLICRIEYADAMAKEYGTTDALGSTVTAPFGGIGTTHTTGCEWIRNYAPGLFSPKTP